MLPFFYPQEHLKILFYYPEAESENRKVRNIGLCEALVNFTKTFNPSRLCEAVHTQRLKQVFLEPETGIWMVMVREGGREGGREKVRFDVSPDCHSADS